MSEQVYLEDFTVEQELPPLTKEPIDQIQLVKYAGASGDFNPLHYMDSIGKMAGTGGVIAHGMLIMGFTGQAVDRWIPRRHLKKLAVRFVGMTKPGDKITVHGKITAIQPEQDTGTLTGEVTAVDQTGDVKIKGTFEAQLPTRK